MDKRGRASGGSPESHVETAGRTLDYILAGSMLTEQPAGAGRP